ncbi:nucleotidyltransferase domain-containing protein [Luteolibacter arcticus]|uniref:Nucleotidyltransferase domain-containing protein n=1 Tax=Luteolibacter arcticus TaxID=1581411 RepID=A0ABT3GN39_9BACT|nr:nucleotidyltransferase domain-containing protein [Luteolibacter arcticus]MCW1924928.1 nucleotidyltransferase domain-containing protein [Luteolibacter arcticus]
MEAAIQALLDRIERQHGVTIPYACESGSRAWGFASPDSDYDIRFIFVRPEKSYLSVLDGNESIDLPLEGELDAGGWDVRKAVRLLGKSNGALVEWLHSPVVYLCEPGFRERWQTTARAVFSPRASRDHYHGLAKQMVLGKLEGEQVRAKDYLYALRSILCARWIADGNGIPPVAFAELVPSAPPEIQALIPGLLEHKARTAESERMPRVPALDDFLAASLAEQVEIPAIPLQPEPLDALLRAEIRRPSQILKPADFTLDRVRQHDLLLLDTVAGSQAYGTAIAGSDEDRRGVFAAPRSFLFGLDAIEQVADERSDQVYYELGHFVALLLKNNPNALELLAMPDDCIRHRHPLFEWLKPEIFLSKLCAKTFGEYAMGQIRKARGLNKKIVNPEPEQRRAMLDFCHVPEGQGSTQVIEWLAARGISPRECGVTAVQHAASMFAIYHDRSSSELRGLVSPKDPDTLIFSSVPREAVPIGWMHFNRDAFQAHCKAHREYWEWVGQRNEERYATNASHGRGYDSKNLMHTLRLLDMVGEIATEGELRVRRPNRDYLLRVRSGEFAYEDLVAKAEEQLANVQVAFEKSPLPDQPDRDQVNALLVEIREAFQA